MTRSLSMIALAGATLFLYACGKQAPGPSDAGPPTPVIRLDGSSTVFPIAEAVAEEYQTSGKTKTHVTVGLSGTGGGLKKLCRGEIDVANASRPILTEEMEQCRAAGVRYIELPIAFDAITVVVNPQNDWVKTLTIADLRKMWEPAAQDTIKRWNQVRSEWPDTPLMLLGPGSDSGTLDYFTETVNGKTRASRGDFAASEDDNVLVRGVENDRNALGYFGFAYYAAHRDRLRAVPIETAGGAVMPSEANILNGSYQPLSRPLFIYVNEASAKQPEVSAFVEFYIAKVTALAPEVGLLALPAQAQELALKHFHDHRLGSVFGGVPEAGVTIENLIERETKL